jgi:ornithine decarboxylase
MPSRETLKKLAKKHGTPLFVVDHEVLRRNYAEFRKRLPRVQVYYAVKANSDPDIVRTFYKEGASFDVASMSEFMMVYKNIRKMPAKKRRAWIWDRIIYANPVKHVRTLAQLDRYRPLVTYDNLTEVKKIQRHAPHAGLILRLNVPNTGSMVELSSKFGASPSEAVNLIRAASDAGLAVEGLSFHVGSQCTNSGNYMQALDITNSVLREAWERGYDGLRIVDIGGGFPVPYNKQVRPFKELAEKLNSELDRLFPPEIEILAEPGRFLVATAATLVVQIIGDAVRGGKRCYYIDDGIYGTFSGILFDHCQYRMKAFKKGQTKISSVFGPTCDALDVVCASEKLPANLRTGDLLYSENVGAYTTASATNFNGMPAPKVVSVNR